MKRSFQSCAQVIRIDGTAENRLTVAKAGGDPDPKVSRKWSSDFGGAFGIAGDTGAVLATCCSLGLASMAIHFRT